MWDVRDNAWLLWVMVPELCLSSPSLQLFTTFCGRCGACSTAPDAAFKWLEAHVLNLAAH